LRESEDKVHWTVKLFVLLSNNQQAGRFKFTGNQSLTF